MERFGTHLSKCANFKKQYVSGCKSVPVAASTSHQEMLYHRMETLDTPKRQPKLSRVFDVVTKHDQEAGNVAIAKYVLTRIRA